MRSIIFLFFLFLFFLFFLIFLFQVTIVLFGLISWGISGLVCRGVGRLVLRRSRGGSWGISGLICRLISGLICRGISGFVGRGVSWGSVIGGVCRGRNGATFESIGIGQDSSFWDRIRVRWSWCRGSCYSDDIIGIPSFSVAAFVVFGFYDDSCRNLSDLAADESKSREEEDAYFMSHYIFIINNNSRNLVLSINKNKFSVYRRTYSYLRVFPSKQQFPPAGIRRFFEVDSVCESKAAIWTLSLPSAIFKCQDCMGEAMAKLHTNANIF